MIALDSCQLIIVHICEPRVFDKIGEDTTISRKYNLVFNEGTDGFYPIYSVAKPVEIEGSSVVYEECSTETGLIEKLSAEAFYTGEAECLRLTDPEASWADEFHIPNHKKG